MVVDDSVVWERTTKGSTLVRTSVGGGPVTEVEGGAGMVPYDSPWAVTDHDGPQRFLNVSSGEEVAPALDDSTTFICSPMWCAGQTSDRRLAAQRADGSGLVVSPNAGSVGRMAFGGRFVTGAISLRRAEDDWANHHYNPDHCTGPTRPP